MPIRALAASDAATFMALRLRGLQECPDAFASSFEEEAGTPLAEIERRLAPAPDRAVFGAFGDGELAAVAGLARETPRKLAHKAHVWGVYVAPERRTRGLGGELLRHALHHAATVLRVRQVTLGVNVRNAAALRLYRKLGFIEYGLERGFLMVDGELHDEYQMVWHAPTPA